jgi:hypothetical protein
MDRYLPRWAIETLWGLVPFILFGIYNYNRQREYARNDQLAPPMPRQLRWAVRHTREDVALLCVLVLLGDLLLAYIAFAK